MEEELFRKIGLTEGEIKVYLALLRLGETTVGAIVRESKVSKSKIYDILDKLIEKGFVGYIIKSGTKYFAANDPKMIMEFINKKSEEIEKTRAEAEKILPKLALQRSTLGQKKVAEVYEGFHGLKAIREDLILTLKKSDEFLVLGAPKIANEKWEGWFLDFHRRRETRGVEMRIIYNSDAKQFGEVRKKFKLTKVKYLPSDLVSPNWIDIFNDVVLFVVILKEPLTFVMRDKSLADSFRVYFDIMWKVSKQ